MKSLREAKTKSKVSFRINKSLKINFLKIINLKPSLKLIRSTISSQLKEEIHHDKFLKLKKTFNRN